ncbi:serine/threonine-protein kinase [Nocardioides sp.]|uniref:serine/threonine-protein kinase n=1 Tax=Nocardioides sp. TaxID=35761 RepID=UPI003784C7AE
MIAGRYALEREVGRGGSGAVWLGRDEVLGRQVALKRLGVAPGGSTPDLARAEREARLAARLNHPHVVAVYDLVTEGDDQWLVMEYVEGTTLAALVARRGALPPEQAAPILRQAADALAAAHAAGIVHRDVKPSNILVAPDGQVKLSDFGIARAEADATLTQTGLVTGSPAYLSPEVATGQPATPASDVWSLGATLFHALAGRAPYDVGDNVLGALYRIVHEDPPRLPDAGWLGPVLEATMSLEPADRWSTEHVRDYLGAGPSVPPPPVPPPVDPAPARTQVLSTAVPPVPPPGATTTPTATTPPATTPVAPAPSRAGRRRSSHGPIRVVGIAVAVVAIVLLAMVAWLLGTRAADDSGGQGATTGSSRGPGSSGGGQSDSSTGSSPAGDVTADGMENFVESYLATVTSDPKAAWEMLTPEFQQASGGYGRYRGFWATISTADLISAQADPGSGQITYTVEYVRTDGSKTREDVTLVLDGTDGGYRIAGET